MKCVFLGPFSADPLISSVLKALKPLCGFGSQTKQEQLDVFFADSELTLHCSQGLFSLAGFSTSLFQGNGGVFTFGLNLKPNFSLDHLDETSRSLLTAQNAGGSSEISETLSFNILHRLLAASKLTMEMDVSYDPPTSKKTDYVCTILGKRCIFIIFTYLSSQLIAI